MIRSMTGYGRARDARDGLDVTVEVRSVNSRYLDCAVKMPRAFLYAEDALKKQVQSAVGRGKVDVFVTVDTLAAGDTKVRVNEPLAIGYIEAMRRLFELGEGMVWDNYYAPDLAKLPDVLTVTKAEQDEEAAAALFLDVAGQALAAYNAMRETEGQKLAEDILSRLDAVENITAKVEERSPQTVEEYRVKLLERMREALKGITVDEGRVLTEAAVYADKVAVDEETVRIRSHLCQLRDLLTTGGGVGRKLDFLLQELNREANTIGSKCSDLQISRYVVDLKSELEKIREQAQNIE